MGTPPFSAAGTSQGYLLNVRWFSLRWQDQTGLQIVAARSAEHAGTKNAPCTEGGECVGVIEQGNWLRFDEVDFGEKSELFEARVAAAGPGGEIEIHLDSLAAPILGVCTVETTGEWQNWVTRQAPIPATGGKHTVYLKFRGRNNGKVELAKAERQQLNYLAKEQALRKGLTVQPPSAVEARGIRDGALISWHNEEKGAQGYNVYRDGGLISPQVQPASRAQFVDHARGAFRYTVSAIAADGKESPPSVPARCEAGPADQTPPQIFLISPTTSVVAGQGAWVTARLLDNRQYEAISATLYGRVPGESAWHSIPMIRRAKAVFTGTLAPEAIDSKGLDRACEERYEIVKRGIAFKSTICETRAVNPLQFCLG